MGSPALTTTASSAPISGTGSTSPVSWSTSSTEKGTSTPSTRSGGGTFSHEHVEHAHGAVDERRLGLVVVEEHGHAVVQLVVERAAQEVVQLAVLARPAFGVGDEPVTDGAVPGGAEGQAPRRGMLARRGRCSCSSKLARTLHPALELRNAQCAAARASPARCRSCWFSRCTKARTPGWHAGLQVEVERGWLAWSAAARQVVTAVHTFSSGSTTLRGRRSPGAPARSR